MIVDDERHVVRIMIEGREVALFDARGLHGRVTIPPSRAEHANPGVDDPAKKKQEGRK